MSLRYTLTFFTVPIFLWIGSAWLLLKKRFMFLMMLELASDPVNNLWHLSQLSYLLKLEAFLTFRPLP
ncbi:hypothetical protein BA190_10355 [Labrys sp. WJW]|nr:hypothetical protein BA190_10355 [Labrys sp. WJW]